MSTKQDYSDGSSFTECSSWFRKQPGLDAQTYKLGITNIDYVFWHDHGKKFMLIEEKRYSKGMEWFQRETFRTVDNACKKGDPEHYKGFHIVQFQKTSPDDGAIFIDKKEVSKDFFIKFLRFEADEKFYKSFFEQNLMCEW